MKTKNTYYSKSLKVKLLSMFLLSLGISLCLSFVLHLMFFQPYYLEHYERQLLKIFDEINTNLYSQNFEELIMDIDYGQQVDIIVAEENLRYALRSHSQTPMTEERLEQELNILIKNNLELLEKKHLCIATKGDSAPPRLVFVKQLSDGRYCILTHPWEPLESNMTAITHFHFLVAGVACLLGLFITLFLSKQFTKPIIEISEATEGLAQLDFKQKITYQSKDELGRLANSINILSKTLEEHRKALKNEIEFQKVLSQNMSHELKTPISVMKGYLEGVTHGIVESEEDKSEYLQIVLEECDRMTSLIDRMLELSKLTSFQEQGMGKVLFSSVAFTKNLSSHCAILLQHHQLSLTEDVPPLEIMGNQELLVQAIGNYVSNAVKYGDGQIISLQMREDADCYEISLFNSGKPIPETEIERIFNVFYMLDKARSRSLNSHGLGLAVCKTIAELHHGTALCVPEENGNRFLIRIPKGTGL